MSDTVLVAVLSLAGTALGTIGGILAANKLTNFRLSELEKKVEKHNNLVERMVQVMPIFTVVREDVVIKNFTRDELQEGAPETMDGYWQVPRLVE